jgi:hypothetical protein
MRTTCSFVLFAVLLSGCSLFAQSPTQVFLTQTPVSGTETIIHSFLGSASEGGGPVAGLIAMPQGISMGRRGAVEPTTMVRSLNSSPTVKADGRSTLCTTSQVRWTAPSPREI